MRYDGESNKIHISLGEFVSIARRRISTTLPQDEYEPKITDVSARMLKCAIGDCHGRKIDFEFSTEKYDFILHGGTDDESDGSVTIAREIESSPDKPKKDEAAEIRALGFIMAYIVAEQTARDNMDIRLIYINPERAQHSIVTETVSRTRLETFFKKCVSAIEIYARPEVERVTVRLPSMKSMKFPYSNIREGQGEFVRAAYRTLARGGSLYASAPTGTGKTVSALYPALRVLGDAKRDKVFYLTPKATGAESVRDCLAVMEKRGAIVRSVILTAKDKCCSEGRICKNSYSACPLAKCNKLAEATLEAYDLGLTTVDMNALAPISKKWQVCPYELSLAYSELCDVVICDINYLFDPSVYIRRYFTAGGNYAILVDEAHNLAERARQMYSAELSASQISAPSRCEVLGEFSMLKKLSSEAEAVFENTLFPYVKEELRESEDGTMRGAVNLSEIPTRIYTLIDELVHTADEEIRINLRASDDERDARVSYLRSYYYEIKKVADVVARFDDAYKMFVFFEDGEMRMQLYCLDTGPVIRERLAKGAGAVLFSATLSPLGYYRSILGGDRSDEMLEVSSSFVPEQLSVSIMDKISTRFSEREDTLLGVCRVIAATISAKRGNYIVFSPSFAYSEALAKAFAAKYPKLHIISQRKNMSAKEKEQFLEEFKKEDKSYLVAFCVMGGIYSEGIDLAGDSLIGAVIVGIGIPSLSYEREAIAEYYQEKYEEGKQYAYIYPGMNRVFQAAGRVIRREDDKGVIVLIDDRFDDPIYKKSLPSLWSGVRFIDDAKRLREILDEFWKEE